MAITLSNQDYTELFEEAIQNGEITCQSNEFETICEYPPQLAQGYDQNIQLRPGLELSISDRLNREYLILKKSECRWPVGSFFHISGNYRCDCGTYVDPGYNSLTGSCVVPKETLEHLAGERIKSVHICIDSHLFGELVVGQLRGLPLELETLIGEGDEIINFAGTTTPSMQVALQQILHCPYQGVFKRMYLEGKVLELLALQLMQLVDTDVPRSHSSLRGHDIDCIHHAKEILIQNLDNPPSLLDLARQVGLNDRKLKQGFHQVFKTTPFAYLRQYRLEQARQLLMDSEISIEQVVKAVGYSDRSRFAVAFRKQFGINPKSYQMQCRKNGDLISLNCG
ncbi:AraC family transcriptional regulator [Chlorogloeopsis sp. ULAP01]|uniref:helix-turn-helix transcriptional regulator n=1 Tax=Chlorogloeopsis sp. ULAP01 TaxID=3056483 RepID=UPI0025AA6B80|nr:AraC family transcriptional regulator [Chlorogloeopsis sp. ULAP01]MDM9383749.1 AraC family transcriptional regulator [Chlorogloeopsis sp. ULAP01]